MFESLPTIRDAVRDEAYQIGVGPSVPYEGVISNKEFFASMDAKLRWREWSGMAEEA